MSDNPTPPASTPEASPSSAPAMPPASPAAQPTGVIEIAKMLQAGTIDTTQAGKLARAAGSSAVKVSEALAVLNNAKNSADPAPVEPSVGDLQQGQVELLNADLANVTPAKPEEFTIRYSQPGEPEAPLSPERKSFDDNVRFHLSEAGFDRTLGNSFIELVDRTGRSLQHMSPSELESYGYQEMTKLKQLFGDQLKDKMGQAARMIGELEAKRPGLRDMIRAGGVWDNAVVVAQIIQASDRYFSRKNAGGTVHG